MADEPESPPEPKPKGRKKAAKRGSKKARARPKNRPPANNGPSKKLKARARAEKAAKVRPVDLDATIQPDKERVLARARKVVDRPSRVFFIGELQLQSLWVTKVTARFLGEIWGLEPPTVEGMANVARTVRKHPEQARRIEDLRSDLTATYLLYAAEAYAAGDRRESSEHLAMVAKLNGALETHHKVTVEHAFGQYMVAIEEKLGPEKAKEFWDVIVTVGTEVDMTPKLQPTVH